MNPQPLATVCNPYTQLYASDITVPASYVATIPTITAPTGDGVLACGGANNAELIITGTGADNVTVLFTVVLWNALVKTNKLTLWVPKFWLSGTATCSALVGVTDAAQISTDRFADTLSIDSGGVANSVSISSATANLQCASVNFDLMGASFIQVITKQGTATAANVLLRKW